MKYEANPVVVDAYKIKQINKIDKSNDLLLIIGDGKNSEVIATKEMLARFIPNIGDYWVIQSDGYVYLNPKDVFERKYHPIEGENR